MSQWNKIFSSNRRGLMLLLCTILLSITNAQLSPLVHAFTGDTWSLYGWDLFEDTVPRWWYCPDDMVLIGFYHSNCQTLGCLEELECAAPTNPAPAFSDCYDQDISISFDTAADVFCNDNYFIHGFYTHVCEELNCLERLWCCRYDPTQVELYDSRSSATFHNWYGDFDVGQEGEVFVNNYEYIEGLERSFTSEDQSIYHLEGAYTRRIKLVTPNPTPSPTPSPTNNPTPSPSNNPTPAPTINPTVSPTSNPTLSPTINPTLYPTTNPTVSPISNPTVSPTSKPTLNPISSPTMNPTASPYPTNKPMPKLDLFEPTISPTENDNEVQETINTQSQGDGDDDELNSNTSDNLLDDYLLYIIITGVLCISTICLLSILIAIKRRKKDKKFENINKNMVQSPMTEMTDNNVPQNMRIMKSLSSDMNGESEDSEDTEDDLFGVHDQGTTAGNNTNVQVVNNNDDLADMLKKYDLYDGLYEILDKKQMNLTTLSHLEEGDINGFCKELEFSITQKIQFKTLMSIIHQKVDINQTIKTNQGNEGGVEEDDDSDDSDDTMYYGTTQKTTQ